jgi:hypothetical protein
MREQLVGYLLGALEPEEREAIEAQLLEDPELREELQLLRERLPPLEDADPIEPPCGLANRACRYVSDRLGPTQSQFGGTNHWRVQDLVVAAGVMLVAGMIVFPAVVDSRNRAQLRVCENNLLKVGQALTEYSDLHDGYFPRVPALGNYAAAGIYAPTLVDSRLIESSDVLCPASTVAAQGDFRVPTLAELRAARGEQLRRMQAAMGGSYGYGLGYVEDGHYHALRNRHRSTFALMADAPDQHALGSSSQGKVTGHNVLFEDGHVKLLTIRRLGDIGDHIFQNGLGYVGAGIGSDDAVIGSSVDAPLILEVGHAR